MFKSKKTSNEAVDAAKTAPRPLSTKDIEAVSGGINPQPLPPINRTAAKRDA